MWPIFLSILIPMEILFIREGGHTVQSSRHATKWMVELMQVFWFTLDNQHLDNQLHTVKKIKLRDNKKSGDGRLLREVSALRQLSHRYIVRYYTTWTETSDSRSAAASDSESDADTVDGITSVPHSHSTKSKSKTGSSENLLSLDLNDFGSDRSRSSFPSIHFGGSGDSSEGSSEGEDDDDGLEDLFDPLPTPKPNRMLSRPRTPTPSTSRTTLYIQMVC
jgi:translation initiation factor 2-alpha kinase 4